MSHWGWNLHKTRSQRDIRRN